jgi:hypothetical protein
MKKISGFVLISALTLAVVAQTNIFLTNDIAIGNRNVWFIIKDYGSTNGDKTVFADKPLNWILYNPTEKFGNVHWQSLERTFSLKLFDSQAHEVPLTDYGKEMNSGPRPLPATGSIHMIPLPPKDVSVRDFPSIDQLFQIPKPGDYIFEARYWYRDATKKEWTLSDPARLKVIKQAREKMDAEITNASSH